MSRHTFPFFFLSVCSHSAKPPPVAIRPSALFGERYSLGARWVFSFSRCCYLIIDPSSYLFGGSRAPGVGRSHLDLAV
jgi:hypothetical protein